MAVGELEMVEREDVHVGHIYGPPYATSRVVGEGKEGRVQDGGWSSRVMVKVVAVSRFTAEEEGGTNHLRVARLKITSLLIMSH